MADILLAFIVENVREAFVEDKRQDKIFELGGVGCSTNGAGSVPELGFQGRNRHVVIGGKGQG